MEKLIERDLFKKIISWINEREIFIIIGPRQSGKTTLFSMIQDFLIKKKKIKPGSIFYFSFENPELRSQFNQNPKEFIDSRIQKIKGKSWWLFDEFHWIKEGGQKLKFIYDFYPQLKIFVTGSSSLELTFKTGKYLVGRGLYFYLYPLNFSEFLKFKDPINFNSYNERHSLLKDLILGKRKKILIEPSIYEENFYKFFEENLLFGGYPAVVKKRDRELKKMTLKSIVNTYLEREIRDLLLIENLDSYRKLLQLLSSQIGQITNYNQLSSDTLLYFKLVKKYLNILEETFVIKKISPFFKNLSSEIRKNPKIYFYDSGLRNSLIESFESLELRPDKGALVENFVFQEIQKSDIGKINFWRTKGRAEVDFILKTAKEIIPIEIKFQKFKKLTFSKSFLSFLTHYSPEKGLILTNKFFSKTKFKKTQILFLPIWYI